MRMKSERNRFPLIVRSFVRSLARYVLLRPVGSKELVNQSPLQVCCVLCLCKEEKKTQHIMWNGTSPRLADAGRLLSLFHLVVDDVFTSVSVLFQPVGMYLHKYEWSGSHEAGDCSLLIRVAQLEFDDGFWECQVTASDFTTQDALTSQPVRLVVRGKF